MQALNSSKKKKDLKVLHFLKELLLFHNIIQIVGTLRIANWLNINKNDANYFLKLKKKLSQRNVKILIVTKVLLVLMTICTWLKRGV